MGIRFGQYQIDFSTLEAISFWLPDFTYIMMREKQKILVLNEENLSSNLLARKEVKPHFGFYKICRMLFKNAVFPVKHLSVEAFIEFLRMMLSFNIWLGEFPKFVEEIRPTDVFNTCNPNKRPLFMA